MRVLIVGGGGREHALAWALAGSPSLSALYVAPGNPGTATLGTNVPIAADDVPALVEWAAAEAIELVIPGPEAPLVAGLADALAARGIACCGPSAEAARLEGSKSFAKEVCAASGIPTALWERCETAETALDFVRRRGAPLVVKADGLAAGKGVVVAETPEEAEAAVTRLAALGPVLIEQTLEGPEVSLFALCDGEAAVLLGAAADHKRVGEGDTGPNTGGMGAVSPPARFGEAAQRAALDMFVRPALAELARRGTPFRGVLFAGLMLTADGPMLIEYNVRLGDPEAQALLPRISGDFLAACAAACAGGLHDVAIGWRDVASVSVVLAANGYPGGYERGAAIGGLGHAAAMPHAAVFHAGTAAHGERIVSAGGRVLTVVGTGADVAEARAHAYAAVDAIDFPGGFCRRDIGAAA